MSEGNLGGPRRYARVVASLAVALVLVGCGGLGLLPYESDIKNTSFQNYQAVTAAYNQITPGLTRASDLNLIGFDASRVPNVEILSYLGVIERFMPRDSIHFDTLAPAVQNCIEARDRCMAYVFRLSSLHQEREGNVLLDLLGFHRITYNHGWSAEVVLLVLDGRVAYKVISGRPNIQDYRDRVQPLGPLQDIGGAAVRTAQRFW